MKLDLNAKIEHLLVLGAGASADYGLPMWNDLGLLIKGKINTDIENRYQYKKEILDWIDTVGEKKKYNTIDQCLKEEASSREYHSNGHEIENEIFLIVKTILRELYKENEGGWLRILNNKILDTPSLENKFAFINYNYDSVLEENFLNFSYLSAKEQLFVYKNRLNILSEAYTDVLYPHGTLFPKKELKHASRINRHIETMKTDSKNYLDAVSCYESWKHRIVKNLYGQDVKLYILGLGGGLSINLNNINLGSIVEINVTIKDKSKEDQIINYLSKKYPGIGVRIHLSCTDLISECF